MTTNIFNHVIFSTHTHTYLIYIFTEIKKSRTHILVILRLHRFKRANSKALYYMYSMDCKYFMVLKEIYIIRLYNL